jgi:hypothetical protein
MAETPKFDSPEELSELLGAFGARMHYVNRVAMGESKFVWWYAELLRAAARLAPQMTDADTSTAFGDGWSKGTEPDPKARLLEMLSRELPDR